MDRLIDWTQSLGFRCFEQWLWRCGCGALQMGVGDMGVLS